MQKEITVYKEALERITYEGVTMEVCKMEAARAIQEASQL
jgi:predicted YcjX-like family ATPase